MHLSSLSLWIHRQSKAKCHTFHLFTLSCGLLIAWVEHSEIEVRQQRGWERGLPGAGGPGEGWWQPATRQESNKTDKWCQDTQILRPTTTTRSSLTAALLTSTPLQYQLHLQHHLPTLTPTIPPSPLENWTALIEHSSVYRSTLPIGFWINRIIFLIKQDGTEEGGGGRKDGTELWAYEWKGKAQAVRDTAWAQLVDAVAEPQFGEIVGFRGEWRWVGRGVTEEKPIPTDGIEDGELIDLLSVFSSEDQWQTEALVFII